MSPWDINNHDFQNSTFTAASGAVTITDTAGGAFMCVGGAEGTSVNGDEVVWRFQNDSGMDRRLVTLVVSWSQAEDPSRKIIEILFDSATIFNAPNAFDNPVTITGAQWAGAASDRHLVSGATKDLLIGYNFVVTGGRILHGGCPLDNTSGTSFCDFEFCYGQPVNCIMRNLFSRRRTRRTSNRPPYRGERGQSLVIIAMGMIGLLAFVGLTVDVGTLYIGVGHLRRAVDAAAIAAASQLPGRPRFYRRLSAAARQVINLNGVIPEDMELRVCVDRNGSTSEYHDQAMCPSSSALQRKLIRVTATTRVRFSFLAIIGWYDTEISAQAVAEAASVDVVLALDTSSSMTQDAGCGDGDDDDGDGVPDDGCPNRVRRRWWRPPATTTWRPSNRRCRRPRRGRWFSG